MRLWMAMAAAVLLAGCATARPTGGTGAGEAELIRLAGEAAFELRAVAWAVEAGGTPDFGPARGALERAQLAAAVQAPTILGVARYAALGVALALCREGLNRLELRTLAGADNVAGGAGLMGGLVAGLRVGCVAPLLLLAASTPEG